MNQPLLSSPPRRFYMLLLLVTVVAAGVRLATLGAQSLWFDEAVSLNYASGDLTHVFQANSHDTTPPLYFLGLFGWRHVFGIGEFALRAYGVCWSLATVVLVGLFCRRFMSAGSALFAALLVAVAPLDIYYAQEARMYSQATALGVCSSFLAYGFIRHEGDGLRRKRYWCLCVAYGLCAAALILTHYIAATLVMAQGLFVLAYGLRTKRKSVVPWLATAAVVCVLACSPWFYYVLHTNGRLALTNINWMDRAPRTDFVIFWGKEFLGGTCPFMRPLMWAATLLALVCAAAALIPRKQSADGQVAPASARVFFLWMIVAPVVLVAGFQLIMNQALFNRERFSTLLVPYFCCLVATGLSFPISRTLGVAVALVMMFCTGWQARVSHKTDWRSFAAFCGSQLPPDKVCLFPTFNEHVVRTYLHPRFRSYRLPEFVRDKPSLTGRRIWEVFVAGFSLKLQEGEYEMISRLGESGWTQTLNSPGDFIVREVHVGEFVPPEYKDRVDFWYEPADQQPRIEGFDSGCFLSAETRAEKEPYTRISRSPAWITMLPPDRATTVTLCVSKANPEGGPVRLSVYASRKNKQPNVFAEEPALTTTLTDQPQEVPILVPAGTGPLTLGWRTPDNARLLRVYWVGVSLSRAPRP